MALHLRALRCCVWRAVSDAAAAQTLVATLNKFVADKKKKTEALEAKKAELEAAVPAGGAKPKKKGKKGEVGADDDGHSRGEHLLEEAGASRLATMDVQSLMASGRKTNTETEKSIQRSARVVEDTLEIGKQTAAMLAEQTKQLEKVVNDLDEIHFSMKKAKKLIGDITRSMATDKCILGVVFLIVAGIVAVIVMKITGVKFTKKLVRPESAFWRARALTRRSRAAEHSAAA